MWKKISARFNIKCIVLPKSQSDPTAIVPYFSIVNESPWAKLFNEADSQRYILTSNEEGNIYLWKIQAGERLEPFHITEGVNIRNIKWTENGAEQFHEYIAVGGGCDPVRIIDDSCPSNRVLTIYITDPFVTETELKGHAVTERNRRKEVKVAVTVSGWGLTDELIKKMGETNGREIFWVPNLLIPVEVPSLGFKKTKLLISEVEYMATHQSMTCNITLVNKGYL